MAEWQKTGIREWESSTRPGLIKKLKYQFIEDSLQYDLLKLAEKIICPVLLIAGEDDETTPPNHQQLLFDKLNTNKELHIIKNTGHTFDGQKSLQELELILKNWINKFR